MAKDKLKALRTIELGDFEGLPVVGVSLEVSNTGYGLERSMAMEPVKLHPGDTVHLLFTTTVDKIRHDLADREEGASGGMIRAQILRADEAVLVDPEVVAGVLEEHRRKLDEARGTPQIEFGDAPLGDSGTLAEDAFKEAFESPVPPRPQTKRERDAAARAAGEVEPDAGGSNPD